ncbi:MAG: very short patch repair endonuclease [Planctomycetota bacterium]
MVDIYSKSKRSEIMSRVRNRRTAPEDKVAALLKELGVKYRRNVKTLPGQPDFVVRSKRMVIFVNGCFWHGHPNCNRAKLPDGNRAFWEKKIATNKRRDRRTAEKLRKENWHVMTVWQCSLRSRERILERLKRELDL